MARVDRKKHEWEVAKEFLKNPLQTLRDVEKATWISRTTVWSIKNNLDKIWQKDERIINITDKDFDLMNIIQEEKFRRLNEEKEKINNTDINKWEETATKRYTLFRWSATDNNWWLNSLSDLSDLELIELLNEWDK